MNSKTLRSLVVALAVAFLSAGAWQTAARQATPAADDSAPIVIEELGRGLPADTPGKALLLQRVVIQPGAVVPPHQHPADIVFSVDAGALGYTLFEGSVEILRATNGATPGPVETLGPGGETILEPGDVVFEPVGVIHIAHNAGDEPVILSMASLTSIDQPFFQPVETTGTPTS